VLATLLCAVSALALPVEESTDIAKRADVCGQWDSQTSGSYIMYNDQWGLSAATSGSQCSGIDSLSGNTIKWHTSWTWAGGPSQVKSYAQIYRTPAANKQVSGYSTIPTTWNWTYTGSNIVADVAYDFFTSNTNGGSTAYEIMIWLAALGGAGPISSTGSTPLATPTIGGHSWKLFKGPNGSTTVFSFVASSQITNFSGDIMNFLNYLVQNQGYPSSQWMTGIAIGTEAFTGSNAKLTSTYSITQ